MGVNSLLKTYPTASRLRFEPSPTALESGTLTTRLPSHPTVGIVSENYERCAWLCISDDCLIAPLSLHYQCTTASLEVAPITLTAFFYRSDEF